MKKKDLPSSFYRPAFGPGYTPNGSGYDSKEKPSKKLSKMEKLLKKHQSIIKIIEDEEFRKFVDSYHELEERAIDAKPIILPIVHELNQFLRKPI